VTRNDDNNNNNNNNNKEADRTITEKTAEGILNSVVKLQFSVAKYSMSRNFLYTTFYRD